MVIYYYTNLDNISESTMFCYILNCIKKINDISPFSFHHHYQKFRLNKLIFFIISDKTC